MAALDTGRMLPDVGRNRPQLMDDVIDKHAPLTVDADCITGAGASYAGWADRVAELCLPPIVPHDVVDCAASPSMTSNNCDASEYSTSCTGTARSISPHRVRGNARWVKPGA